MRKVKIMLIFGTRPEAIKMAPLILELNRRKQFETIVVVTGQQREMLDQVLRLFKIKPDYDLNIMKKGQTLFDIIIKTLEGLEKVISKIAPDIILIHGDTSTSFAASLAAFCFKIPIGHVEAGLRTYNKYSPFPEEMNRQLTDVLTDIYFSPTKQSADNLIKEGKSPEAIYITGNTGIDALKTTVQKSYKSNLLNKIGNGRIILLTAHRRENLGGPLQQIFRSVRKIVTEHHDVQVIFPVHLNPVVRNTAFKLLEGHPRIHLVDPLNVIDFHNIAARSTLILTDSGGIQEEAPSLGIPVLVLRNTTERPEGITAKILRLVGTDERRIFEVTHQLLTDNIEYQKMSKASNPYGDGNASQRIADALLYYFNFIDKRPTQFGEN